MDNVLEGLMIFEIEGEFYLSPMTFVKGNNKDNYHCLVTSFVDAHYK